MDLDDSKASSIVRRSQTHVAFHKMSAARSGFEMVVRYFFDAKTASPQLTAHVPEVN